MRRFFRSEFNSHDIGKNGQSSGDNKQSIPNCSAIDDGAKLFGSHFEYRSKTMAMIMLTIPRVSDFVNVAGSKLMNPGPIKIRANQPADKFPKIPERTLKNDFLTMLTLAEMQGNYYNSSIARIAVNVYNTGLESRDKSPESREEPMSS